ncbi:MAG: PEGA domain-containing protein [Deltaproteobacteria bacterium]
MSVSWLATLYAALPRVAFVPIVVGGQPPTTAAAIHAALVEEVQARPVLVEPLSYNQLLVQSPTMSASTVRDCGADAACVAEVFRGHALRFIVVAAVNFELEPWSAALTIIDPETMRSTDRLVPLAADGDRQVLENAISQAAITLLTASGAVHGGHARLALTPEAAQVEAPAELEAVGPLRYRGPPGTYALRAEAEGYEPGATSVQIVAGQEALARLTLEPEGGLLTHPAFWVVTGVVVAAGVTAGVLLAGSGDPAQQCYTTPDRGCP